MDLRHENMLRMTALSEQITALGDRVKATKDLPRLFRSVMLPVVTNTAGMLKQQMAITELPDCDQEGMTGTIKWFETEITALTRWHEMLYEFVPYLAFENFPR